jgi:hypothetical protein
MSLITLNSNGQLPYFYSTHFPQPIKIEPFSQVCLLKFLHFRDGSVFNITSSNNLLMYFLGNTDFDAIRIARLTPGQYTGPDLATEIARAMNDVCQQQHYNFTCTHTAEDDTTSPPTPESFSISFASLPQPTEASLAFVDAQLQQTNYTYNQAVNNTFIRRNPGGFTEFNSLISNQGILTHLGQYTADNIGFDMSLHNSSDKDANENFGFNLMTIGIVRNELSDLNNENEFLKFNKDIQDVYCEFDSDGIHFGTVDIKGNTKPGTADYAKRRECRLIPNSALKGLITNVGGKDINDMPNIRLRVVLNIVGISRRAVCQLQVSYDMGATYADLGGTDLGNDPQGNAYVANFTDGAGNAFTSSVWVSDNNNFNDENADGVNQSKQNVITTKKAPLKATFFQQDIYEPYGLPDFVAGGLNFSTDANSTTPNALTTFTNYTGDHGYNFRVDIDGGPTYYLMSNRVIPGATAQNKNNINLFRASTTDVAYTDAGTTNATYDFENETLTIEDGGNNEEISEDNAADLDINPINDIQVSDANIVVNGIQNPNNRPLTNMNVADGSPFDEETELALKHFADFGTEHNVGAETITAGADLGRACGLFLRQLNNADVAANSGAPANLKQGQTSGTLGSTIGSDKNFILTASSTGANIFSSGQSVQKVAKDSIIKVSVPEFSGLKSFQGIDQGAGQNLSGEGKDLAVLPKEEFKQLGESVQNSLVYVSPFENWLDINNGQELYLNQLTVEVRQPEGNFAEDLRPDSIAQLKIRKDPNKQAQQNMYEAFNKAVLQSSSAETTGNILSANIYNKGS